MSRVTCHMSRVTCHMSHFFYFFFFFFFSFFSDKVVKLIGGGSVINGASLSSFDSLYQELSHALELEQKKPLCIILGSQYRSYNNALLLTNLLRLVGRQLQENRLNFGIFQSSILRLSLLTSLFILVNKTKITYVYMSEFITSLPSLY